MLDAVFNGLDVPVEHRTVRADAQAMSGAMDLYPIFTRQLLVGDGHPHALSEDLGATARQCVETGLAQGCENFLDRKFIDASDVGDLDGGQSLDVDVGVSRFET